MLDGEVEYITRSGRCYGPEEVEKKKGKEEVRELAKNAEEGAKKVERGESSEKRDAGELLL